MKLTFFFLSLTFISCFSNAKKKEINDPTPVVTDRTITAENRLIDKESTFEETQDSLRKQLLNSKPNENLKSSILQELYIRGLVNQDKDKINFKLPFNLHGFDCGAPDCYSTDITFFIPLKEPVKFPKTIDFHLFEHGCVDHEISYNGKFELVEIASEYVNYYSKTQNSNLVIMGKGEQLYYFPNTEPNSIKVNLINEILEDYDDENPNAKVPYRSTTMITNEYENFVD